MNNRTSAKKNRSGGEKIVWVLICGLVLVLGIVAIPSGPDPAIRAPIQNCINNLRQLDGAKEQVAQETHLKPGDLVGTNEVAEYIKHGMPHCPMGGTYFLHRIGKNPTCSIPLHALP